MSEPLEEVWVFSGNDADFPCGVFRTRQDAEAAITRNRLEGTLTKYPLDTLVYDWAIAQGLFKPKRESQRSAGFIQRFTSGSQEHYHYEQGGEGK